MSTLDGLKARFRFRERSAKKTFIACLVMDVVQSDVSTDVQNTYKQTKKNYFLKNQTIVSNAVQIQNSIQFPTDIINEHHNLKNYENA